VSFARAVVDPSQMYRTDTPRTRQTQTRPQSALQPPGSCEEEGEERGLEGGGGIRAAQECPPSTLHPARPEGLRELLPVPRLPFLPWAWENFVTSGDPELEEWLRATPENALKWRDLPLKVEAAAERVDLPCAVTLLGNVELTWGTVPYTLDLVTVHTPLELKARLYRSVVLDNCGEATLTSEDFEGLGGGGDDGSPTAATASQAHAQAQSSAVARRLFLRMCELPEFPVLAAEMVLLVLEQASGLCGTRGS